MTVRRGFFILSVLCLLLPGCTADPEHKAASATLALQKEDSSNNNEIMDALRNLAPPEGVRLTRLFDDKAASAKERLARLERAVQALRDDVDTIAPVTLDLVQKNVPEKAAPEAPVDLRAEEKEPPPESLVPVDTETRNANIERLLSAAGADLAPQAQEKAKAPANASGGAIRQARTADHADKTRLVLDMTASATPKAHLENDNKKMIIDLPLPWTGEASFKAMEAQLISGWQIKDGKLEVALLYPSQIKQQFLIPAQKGNSDYRFVIDLYSADVHKK